jgi:hypothetical protein
MDAIAGMSPSMETIAAGFAGFTLATLFSFARKPQVIKQKSPSTSSIVPNTAAVHFPSMGHDFHILARLVGEKQQRLDLLASPFATEQSIQHMLKEFRPQLAEFSSFEWHTHLNGQNYPKGSQVVGRHTYIMYATNAPSQIPGSASHTSMVPALVAWSDSRENYPGLFTAEREIKPTRPIGNTPAENCDGQHDERRRKGCGRDKDDEARRSRRGWCRSRDEDTSPANWGWFGAREDYRDRWDGHDIVKKDIIKAGIEGGK